MEKKITKEIVVHAAKLANLTLSNEEIEKFTLQLEEVVEYNVSLLKDIDTSKVEPTAHVAGLVNVTREDKVETGLTKEEALKNGSSTHNDFFLVAAILD